MHKFSLASLFWRTPRGSRSLFTLAGKQCVRRPSSRASSRMLCGGMSSRPRSPQPRFHGLSCGSPGQLPGPNSSFCANNGGARGWWWVLLFCSPTTTTTTAEATSSRNAEILIYRHFLASVAILAQVQALFAVRQRDGRLRGVDPPRNRAYSARWRPPALALQRLRAPALQRPVSFQPLQLPVRGGLWKKQKRRKSLDQLQ